MQPDDPRDDEGSDLGFSTNPPPLPEVDETPAAFPDAPAAIPIARPVLADGAEFGLTPLVARWIRPDMPWWLALVELIGLAFLGIGGALGALPVMAVFRPADDRWLSVIASVTAGLAVTAGCIAALKLERRPLSSIGLTARGWALNIAIGVVGFICTYVALTVLLIVASTFLPQINKHDADSIKGIQETFPPMGTTGTIAFMCLVATWEEIAFRGFLLTRLQAMFKRWWLSVPVGAMLFGLGHIYEGPIAIPMTMLLGVALGLLFWWRKSLVPGIVFHALNNIVAFLMMQLWLEQQTHS